MPRLGSLLHSLSSSGSLCWTGLLVHEWDTSRWELCAERPGDEFHFSDNEGESDDAPDDAVGDYSTRFDELMSDGEEDGGRGHGEGADEDEDEDEGGFVYSGVDADPTGGYREQLRDVLGPDHEEDELEEEQEVERSLVHEVEENEKFAATIEDEAGVSLVHILRIRLHQNSGHDSVLLNLWFVYCGHCSTGPSK